MIDILVQLFAYSFVRRAVIIGILISLCAALLGVSLVLKRYSMIGDGLSHVGFGTLAIAVWLNLAPLYVSIPVVLLAAFLLLRISENAKIKGDAAIALVSSASLAIGAIVISKTTGMNSDVCNYMFGSVLTTTDTDLIISIVVSVVVLILYIVFYNKIFAVTFDNAFSKATGTKTGVYNLLIAFLTALIIVIGMRLMGAMLISSLIIFPALSSMRLFRSFKGVVLSSAVISVVCFLTGMVLSFSLDTPTGASVVAANLVVFLMFSLAGMVQRRTVTG